MTFIVSDDLMMEACLKYTIMLDSWMSFAENKCKGDTAMQLCSVNTNFYDDLLG